jgi:uncharacterized protein
MAATAHEHDSTACSLARKVLALRAPSTFGQTVAVEVVETHMSYVFLAGGRAYKLKKPVRYPFLDFSTLEARERDCREELRLNRRLAPDVYLGVTPLTMEGERLSLGGAGVVVDWLVEMRRLPRTAMLDHLIAAQGVDDRRIDALCDTLAAFYRRATPSTISEADYVARFFFEQALNREALTAPGVGLCNEAAPVLDSLDMRLAEARETLAARARDGHVVDGHGDLRPEHICLDAPVVIFDCLEFNASLRQVDPFDEIALLGVECAQLGAPHLLRRFTDGLARRLDQPVPWPLVGLYGAARAALRARLSYVHLLEPSPRDPQRWEPLARRHLDIAGQMLKLDF